MKAEKNPSEIVQEFIDFLESSKTEYEEAKVKCDKYDSIDRHIYWAHKFELASDKNERNRLATAYQKERLDRRACKNTVDRLKTIHDFVCSDNNKGTLKRMKGMIQVQKSQEDYLDSEKEYKGGEDG